MNVAVKALGVLVCFAVALTMLDRWKAIFYEGRLYENLNTGIAVLGFFVPILFIVVAIYLVVKIIRA